jgi:hypothetical protein
MDECKWFTTGILEYCKFTGSRGEHGDGSVASQLKRGTQDLLLPTIYDGKGSIRTVPSLPLASSINVEKYCFMTLVKPIFFYLTDYYNHIRN